MSLPATPVRVMQLISSLEVGGAEMMLLAFLKSVQKSEGTDVVTVILNDLFHQGLRSEIESLNGQTHFFERTPSNKHPRYVQRLLSLIDQHRIQLIHVHDPGSRLAALACKMLRPNLKIVFTVHDTHIIDRFSSYWLWVHRLFIDGHIAISGSVEKECRQFGIQNVRKIYNGVNLSNFQRKPITQPQEERPLRLVQVARFELEKKGQDLLLRAIRRCLDLGYPVECSLVGMVTPSMEDQFLRLNELINKLELSHHVHLLTNRTDVPIILLDQDVFILPSRKEGFGLVIIEAMASGLPVIASNLDGPAELICTEENGLLFEPENPEHLASLIIRLHKDVGFRNSLAQKGYQSAQSYSIETMTFEYLRYYRTLTTGKA